ncbi:MAG: hypothetical protein WEB58_17360 [Planctomycetaceae bacterium]
MFSAVKLGSGTLAVATLTGLALTRVSLGASSLFVSALYALSASNFSTTLIAIFVAPFSSLGNRFGIGKIVNE